MRVIRIADAYDARLADYAGVREPALLSARGLVAVEGRLVARRLVAAGRVAFQSFLLNDAALTALADVLEPTDAEVYVATPDVIAGAAGFNMHRGCLALAIRPPAAELVGLMDASRLVVALERVVDADNVGSVFRNAEAFGVDAVLLSPGCCDPLYRKALRTSSGAALMVPFAAASPWTNALERLRTAGFALAALTPGAGAMDIRDFLGTKAARGRLVVLLGTEGHGLTAETLACADVRLRIPMTGGLDSLNVATAAGIALHRLHEARTTM